MWILWLVVLALLPFTSVYLYVAGFVGFFVCLILFYKTTIIIDDEFFTFKLGAKFLPLQTVYKLSEIEKCIPVDEPEVRGRGRIRHFNMLCNRFFNVTAVELHFKGKDTVVQLETGQAYKIGRIMNRRLNEETDDKHDNNQM